MEPLDAIENLPITRRAKRALNRAGFFYVDELIHLIQTQGDPALYCLYSLSTVTAEQLRHLLRGRSPRLFDGRLTHAITTSYNTVFPAGYVIRDLSIHHANRFDQGIRGGLWRASVWDPNVADLIELRFFGDEIQFIERELANIGEPSHEQEP